MMARRVAAENKEAPVDEAVDQNDRHRHQGLPCFFYRAALPLSRKTLNYVAGIVRRHRASIGSPWRKLKAGQQALLVLACLRKGEAFAELAAGFGVGTATAWRYVNETVELLAARAPKLRQAVRDAVKAGYAYVVLDGTLISVDQVAADRPFYSGKRPTAPTRNSAHPAKGKCRAQELEDPPQAPLLPLAHRTTRQGLPHPGDPRGITRMKKVIVPRCRLAAILSRYTVPRCYMTTTVWAGSRQADT